MDTNTKLEGLKQFRETMADKNDFELLGVEESADDAAVRSAYFGLIKLYGADFFHHVVDAESREAIDDVNRRLRAAYDNIGKEAKRKLYIERLHGGVAFEADAHIDIADVFECEQALSQARALMERGEFAIALQKLEKAQKLDKKSMEIRARLAYVHFMLMDESGAAKTDRSRGDSQRHRRGGQGDGICRFFACLFGRHRETRGRQRQGIGVLQRGIEDKRREFAGATRSSTDGRARAESERGF